MSTTDEIISEMTECEKRIMNIVGRINASPNKNFTRQTLKKKATADEKPHVDSVISALLSKGLLIYYRAPDNLATTNLGFNVSQKLKEERLKRKYNMRIIRR